MITLGSASRLQRLHRLHILTIPRERGSLIMSRRSKTLMRVVFPLTDLACFAVSLGASKLPVRPAVFPLLTLWLDIVAGLQLFL